MNDQHTCSQPSGESPCPAQAGYSADSPQGVSCAMKLDLNKYGWWTLLEEPRRGKNAKTKCQCKCGTIRMVQIGQLKFGSSKSCGCLSAQLSRERFLVHGKSRKNDTEYTAWLNMRNRCSNPRHPSYKEYGGRGIVVCDRWNNFTLFFEDMGPKPDKSLSLERIDVNKGYNPDNCTWATSLVQASNQRRKLEKFDFRGAFLTIPDIARMVGIHHSVLRVRIRSLKWEVERAATTPVSSKA